MKIFPCEIGDFVYTIDNINPFYPEHNKNIYKGYSIKKHHVEGFIVDEYGIHIAENNAPDGWVYLITYQACSRFDQVFFSIEDAKLNIDESEI